MNQELEQYHRQKDWPEQLVTAEFVVNNKIYSATKVSLFIANYGRELRIGADIRRKKDGEDDRVCKKDEEGTRGSWSSTNKGTKRNEVVSGQRENRS